MACVVMECVVVACVVGMVNRGRGLGVACRENVQEIIYHSTYVRCYNELVGTEWRV